MKHTKLMLAFIASLIVTWLSLGFISFFLLGDAESFRVALKGDGVILFMLLFGWIPAVVVAADLEKRLEIN